MAWAVFGLSTWIEDGHTLTKSAMEGDKTLFTEENGFMIHGMNGMMLIPLVALVLLIVSFFAKVPEGVKWAAMVFVGVILQVALGIVVPLGSRARLPPRHLGAPAVLARLPDRQAGRRGRGRREPRGRRRHGDSIR